MEKVIIQFIEKRYKNAVRSEKHRYDAVFHVQKQDHTLCFEIFTDKDTSDVFLTVVFINEAAEFNIYAWYAPSDERQCRQLFDLLRI